METALEAEEHKMMQNMLQPIQMVSDISTINIYFLLSQDRERAAYTKIEQYNSNGGVPASQVG